MEIIEKLPKPVLILIQIILNNLIAVTIHICMCILLLYPIFVLYGMGSWLFYIPIAFYLYFWAGKKFLSNTHNALTNVFSVIALVIMLIISAYVWNDLDTLTVLMVPFFSLLTINSVHFSNAIRSSRKDIRLSSSDTAAIFNDVDGTDG